MAAKVMTQKQQPKTSTRLRVIRVNIAAHIQAKKTFYDMVGK